MLLRGWNPALNSMPEGAWFAKGHVNTLPRWASTPNTSFTVGNSNSSNFLLNRWVSSLSRRHRNSGWLLYQIQSPTSGLFSTSLEYDSPQAMLPTWCPTEPMVKLPPRPVLPVGSAISIKPPSCTYSESGSNQENGDFTGFLEKYFSLLPTKKDQEAIIKIAISIKWRTYTWACRASTNRG